MEPGGGLHGKRCCPLGPQPHLFTYYSIFLSNIYIYIPVDILAQAILAQERVFERVFPYFACPHIQSTPYVIPRAHLLLSSACHGNGHGLPTPDVPPPPRGSSIPRFGRRVALALIGRRRRRSTRTRSPSCRSPSGSAWGATRATGPQGRRAAIAKRPKAQAQAALATASRISPCWRRSRRWSTIWATTRC